MSSRQVFLGLLSLMLLAIFVYLLWEAYWTTDHVLKCSALTGQALMDCEKEARKMFTTSMESGMNTIGGLIAAIVVGELAITKPTEVPAARLFAVPAAPGGGAAPPDSTLAKASSIIYLSVWALTGMGSFIWASLLHPEALKALTDYGSAWFGLAIASGYSYFGVNRA